MADPIRGPMLKSMPSLVASSAASRMSTSARKGRPVISNLYSIAATAAGAMNAAANLERARIASLPILVMAVHTQCNCRCEMCDIWKRKDGRETHAAELDRHRESIRALGVKNVVFTGGEPLMNRNLESICEFFRELDVRISLLTTGLLLGKRVELIAQYVDDIFLSIDGPPEVHDRIRRVPRAFEIIREGVRAVRERRPQIPITCRTTVQKLNHTAMCSTVEAVRSLGAHKVSFLAADVTSSAFNREDLWDGERQGEVALNADEVAELEAEIARLIETHALDIESGFIAESAPKLRRIGDHFRKHLEGVPPKSPICNAPWVSAVVEVDGSVRPCFFHSPFANLHALTLAEAINSEAALRFRSQLDIETNPICQKCVCSLNYKG